MKTQSTSLLGRTSVSLLLCGVIVFSGFQVFSQDWTEEQKEVWKRLESGWEVIKQGDLKVLDDPDRMANVHKDALEWWSTKAIPLNREAAKMNYRSWLNWEKVLSYELKPLEIQIVGNVAILFYLSKYKGTKASGRNRHMTVYIRQDNKWIFLGSMSGNCNKPSMCTN